MEEKDREEDMKAWKTHCMMIPLMLNIKNSTPEENRKEGYIQESGLYGYIRDKPHVLNERLDAWTYLALCWMLFKIVFLRKGKKYSYMTLSGFISEHRTDNGSEILPNH